MIRRLTAPEVKALLDEDPTARLLDVRTEAEWRISRIAHAVRATRDSVEKALATWDRATPVIVVCHHGVRSMVAGMGLTREGFTNVVNLDGGMEAWSREVDAKVRRYRIMPSGAVVAA